MKQASALDALFKPGEVIELRVVEHGSVVANGYFNDFAKLHEATLNYSGKEAVFYVSVNPVRASLLNVANNRLRRPAGWIALNADIKRRATLVIRCAVTNNEAAYQCRNFLTIQHWPEPLVVVNRESVDLLYAIDLPNNIESTELIRQVLAALARRVDGLDGGLSEAAAICPLLDRTSKLPDKLEPVSRELLIALPSARLSAEPSQAVDNPLHQFVLECCILRPEVWMPTGTLYAAFQAFCERKGVQAIAAPHFARRLITDFGLKPQRRKVVGVVTRGLWGIWVDGQQSS